MSLWHIKLLVAIREWLKPFPKWLIIFDQFALKALEKKHENNVEKINNYRASIAKFREIYGKASLHSEGTASRNESSD